MFSCSLLACCWTEEPVATEEERQTEAGLLALSPSSHTNSSHRGQHREEGICQECLPDFSQSFRPSDLEGGILINNLKRFSLIKAPRQTDGIDSFR